MSRIVPRIAKSWECVLTVAGGPPYNRRQLAAYQNHLQRISPFEWARRYQAELEGSPGITKVDVARRFGVSRVRVVQYLNLLKVDPRIVEYIDANFGDPIVAVTSTERLLRELLATTESSKRWSRCEQMLKEARSNPGIWNDAS
ncbi:MAG: hypothetical protein HYY16_04840 [Planctomycetes bacterium]|nr:hypothetical protein [Planctomycetota bacterium]